MKWAEGEPKRIGLAGYDPRNANKLFISNIPVETTEEELKELFSLYGSIMMLYYIKDPRATENNRCYLKYLTKEQALVCIKEVNGVINLHNSPKNLEVMLIEQKKAVRAMSMYAPKENALGVTVLAT